jgi:methoxymalonate biosynthesis acyl carrier protein
MNEKKVKIKQFLTRFFRKHELGDDEDIFLSGFVNSLFAMQLVMFIEKDFSIKIDNKDMDIENFRTINKICDLVERKS